MKNNILKISLFLFILFSFIFLLNNNCFATVNTNYGDFPENETYTSKDYHYIIINRNNSEDYNFIFIPKNRNLYLYINTGNQIGIYNLDSISLDIYYCVYNINSGFGSISTRSINKTSDYANSSWVINTPLLGNFSSDGLRHLIYSDFNIYNTRDGYNNNSIYMYATTSNQSENKPEIPEEELTVYDVAVNINKMLSVLTFVLIIIFLYLFIRVTFFKIRK